MNEADAKWIDDFVCCDPFKELIKGGLVVSDGKYYETTLLAEGGDVRGTITVRFCPFCGEGELFDPVLLVKDIAEDL